MFGMFDMGTRRLVTMYVGPSLGVVNLSVLSLSVVEEVEF
jgi:hypothetical protein